MKTDTTVSEIPNLYECTNTQKKETLTLIVTIFHPAKYCNTTLKFVINWEGVLLQALYVYSH